MHPTGGWPRGRSRPTCTPRSRGTRPSFRSSRWGAVWGSCPNLSSTTVPSAFASPKSRRGPSCAPSTSGCASGSDLWPILSWRPSGSVHRSSIAARRLGSNGHVKRMALIGPIACVEVIARTAEHGCKVGQRPQAARPAKGPDGSGIACSDRNIITRPNDARRPSPCAPDRHVGASSQPGDSGLIGRPAGRRGRTPRATSSSPPGSTTALPR